MLTAHIPTLCTPSCQARSSLSQTECENEIQIINPLPSSDPGTLLTSLLSSLHGHNLTGVKSYNSLSLSPIRSGFIKLFTNLNRNEEICVNSSNLFTSNFSSMLFKVVDVFRFQMPPASLTSITGVDIVAALRIKNPTSRASNVIKCYRNYIVKKRSLTLRNSS